MKKIDMLCTLPICTSPIHKEYVARGYSPLYAWDKAINWYMRRYTKDEIRDMYNEYHS